MDIRDVLMPILIIALTFIISYSTKVEIEKERKNNIFYTGKCEKRILFIWCICMLYVILFYR